MMSVVIPTYGHWELTHNLLFDIYNFFPRDVEVIVMDDCSHDLNTYNGLIWWKARMIETLRVYTNSENLGFLKNANLGISKAGGDFVILISNDVSIKSRGLFQQVVDLLEVVPPTLVGIKKYEDSTGWNEFDVQTIFPYLDGCFLAFHKETWDNFGGFDERYAPYDFEDVDISTTYLHNGGKLVAVYEGLATHLGAQTNIYSPEREAHTKRNKVLFGEKWLHTKP